MDAIVRAAMQKWPNVPACYGWLGLDRRGDWYLRDANAQAMGAFQSGVPGAKGARLEHDGLRAFIERNYASDARGCWYFQNGPQRVFVELEAAPWIVRVHADFSLYAHDGVAVSAAGFWTDRNGWLYVETPRGLGLVHSQDVVTAVDAIEAMGWLVQDAATTSGIATWGQRFAFVASPAAQPPEGAT